MTLQPVDLDVQMLKAFDPSDHSPASLKSMAEIDRGEEVIDKIISYTGNPTRKNSLEFRVHWMDSDPADDTYHWHRQIKDTVALEAFIALHPELKVLDKR